MRKALIDATATDDDGPWEYGGRCDGILIYVERNKVCYCYSSYREEGTPASFNNSPWCHAHAQVQPE